jgi:1-deoxy-D-xylulose-5-phosphate reductoisomerase
VETNLAKYGNLTFEAPDLERFPSLGLARRAGEIGGTMPAVMNAANEVAVEAFCSRSVGFEDITRIVARTMERHEPVAHADLEAVLTADAWARRHALTA